MVVGVQYVGGSKGSIVCGSKSIVECLIGFNSRVMCDSRGIIWYCSK